jgi:uncharacterized protein
MRADAFTWEATTLNPSVPRVMRLISLLCYNLSRVLIMAFYVTLIPRRVHHDAWHRLLGPMAIAGRMSLTNYLMQTLLATGLFYGWGFGFWGKAGPALDLAIAVAIFFFVQVPLSRLWLRRFELGPLEYLWRVLVYGSTMLRSSSAASAA